MEDTKVTDKVVISQVDKTKINKASVDNDIIKKFKDNGVISTFVEDSIVDFDLDFVADISPINFEKVRGRKLGIKDCSITFY